MLRPNEACRVSMEYVRYMRDSDICEWGRILPLTREGIAFERRTTKGILSALRAARRNETTLAERWGVAP